MPKPCGSRRRKNWRWPPNHDRLRPFRMKFPTKTAMVLVGLGLAWTFLFGFWTTSFHEKLTLTVSTPNGQKSASAVTAISSTREFGVVYSALSGLTNGGTGSSKAWANAVALEIAPDRWLFTLVVQEDGASIHPLGSHGFYDPAKGIPLKNHRNETLQAALLENPPGTQIDLPRHVWPALVTFTDLADPLSMQLVNPDDLAASFGPGFSLAGLSLSLADAPSDSKLLHKLLPWLCTKHDNMMTPDFMNLSMLERQIQNLSRPENFINYVDPACSPRK